jgi:hypothetical protein
MKGMIKKFSVIASVSVVALFIMVGMALAHDPVHHYYINGVYAVAGLTSCSPEGIAASPGIMEGDYTFRHDGTVSVSNGFVRNIPGLGPTLAVRGEFTYTITKEGRIKFEYPSGGLQLGMVDEEGYFIPFGIHLNAGPSHGVLSPDHKTITITCGPPVGPLWQIDEKTGSKIPGTDVWCVTSLTGVRIN